jgi:hypothetical protein
MSYIAGIAMKHQYRQIFPGSEIGRANEEGGELLIVRRGDHQLFEICDAEVGGPGDICAGSAGDVRGVDQGPAQRLAVCVGVQENN